MPDGTWFVRMRIDDKATWEKIKEEGLSGFSVECFMGGVEIGEALSKTTVIKTEIDNLLEGKF